LIDPTRIVSLPDVHASRLGNTREIRVYLPPGYMREPEARYPVLYMHVGQLALAPRSPTASAWEMHRALDDLIGSGKIREILLVAVEHKPVAGGNEFLHELSAYPVRCLGEDYEHFLVRELKPLIDRIFRTLPEPEHTALMGSSAAGLATYNIGLRNPDSFGNLGILSPFFVRVDPYTLEETKQYRYYRLGPRQKAWLDMGSAEGFFMAKHVRPVAEAWLREGAKQGERLAYLEQPGAAHSERDWGRRAHLPLLFFFGGDSEPENAVIHGPDTVGLKGPEAYLNAVVTCGNGFAFSDLEGRYETDRPDVLEVAPNGKLLPRGEGTANVIYRRRGVEARHRCVVVGRLSETVEVEIEAAVPESTEPDARVYANFELTRIGERLYGTRIALPRGMTIDFHMTRGYGRNEGDREYRPIPFRRLTADRDKSVRYEVESWLDLRPGLTEEERKEGVW